MNFSDNKHYPYALAFHGVEEIDAHNACQQEVIDALNAWEHRSNQQSRGLQQLRVKKCPLFSISYDGVATDHWPDESANDISETLIREFLYHDGICTLTEPRAHLFHARYKLLSMSGEDCLLVCPFLTAAGNIGGMVVVTVTKKVNRSFIDRAIR